MVRIHVWDGDGRYRGYIRVTYEEAHFPYERDRVLREKYGEYGRIQMDPLERYSELDFEPKVAAPEPIIYENEEDDPFNDLYYDPWRDNE